MSSIQARIQHAISKASPSLARVGHWMSQHPVQTLSASADEIARLTGTSVAAINRFSCLLGFEGFSHLKTSLGQELASVMGSVKKVGAAHARVPAHALNMAAVSAAASAPDVRLTAGRLLKARNVWLLGLGASNFVAGYAAHVLMPYLPQAWAVSGPGGTEVAARRLTQCGKQDVLVAFSLPRYSSETVSLVTFARQRGVHVVAVVDRADAPLALAADLVLLAPADHDVMPSSALGALAVVEALATEVMRLNPDALRIAHDLSEVVLPHLTLDVPSNAPPYKETP